MREYNKWDENTADFIRFYAKKWRAKSIFQVLLQYRAAKYHDLYNLSQQVHLYNQQFVHNCQSLSDSSVDLAAVDAKAHTGQWLGDQRLTVWKLPFRLDEIPFFDTSYMCDPFTNPGSAMEPEESWDSPLRWRENVASHITRSIHNDSCSYEKPQERRLKDRANDFTKNSTCSSSPHIRASSFHLINLPYNREPTSNMDELRPITPEPDDRRSNRKQQANFKNELKQKDMYGQRNQCPPKPPASPSSYAPVKFSYTSTPSVSPVNKNVCFSKPANQDFEYIKTSSAAPSTFAPKPKAPMRKDDDPITELEKIGKRNSGNAGDDDPPFNFQGLLRKTQFNRESMKRSVENVCAFNKLNNVNNRFNEKYNGSECNGNAFYCKEIRPGVVLEGIVVDL